MKTRVIVHGFLILLLLAGNICICAASAPAVPEMVKSGNTYIAPYSPAYYSWLNARYAVPSENPEGHGLGLIPSPVDLSGAIGSVTRISNVNNPAVVGFTLPQSEGNAQPTSTIITATASSDRYDLRALGKLTPIRNQGQDGNCWAFASIASLESSLLPGEKYDFSENNEKNMHGFSVPINYGGNDFMATAYLARWSGPVLEASDPYSEGSTLSLSGIPVEKQVNEVFFIPPRKESLDNDQIKSMVKQYGAVYSTIRYETTSYTPRTAAYYYSGSGAYNHAIDIVGWDDGYSTSNFGNTPPGNGAFIARNSWGSTWGDAGYFYISYYDTRIGRDNAMFTAQSKNTYSRIYQFDPLGWVANFGFGTDTAYFANVYSSAGNEQLKAVGFYTTATDTDYVVKVYINPDSGPISSGGYSSEQNGIISLPGYHTIRLDNSVNLIKGDRFSVVVKVVSPGSSTPVAVELPINGYSSAATASTGQSYISNDGAVWSDLIQSQTDTNVCLKAYTVSGSTPATVLKSTNPSWKSPGPYTSTLLKNLTWSSTTVKGRSPLVFLNKGSGNQTNPTGRNLLWQSYTRNISQSFAAEPGPSFSIDRIITGNVSSTTSSARKFMTTYLGTSGEMGKSSLIPLNLRTGTQV